MSIFVQAWVYAHSEAQLADRLVLLAIADEADDDGTNAYPSQDRIAHKARLSRSTVQRSIASLEEAGALVVVRPATTGRGKFNRYQIVMGITSGDSLGIAEEGPQDEALLAKEGPKRAHDYGQDPSTHRSISKGPQSEALSGTSLGRGLDAEPLWELDEDGNAVYLGPGPAPRPAARTWT